MKDTHQNGDSYLVLRILSSYSCIILSVLLKAATISLPSEKLTCVPEEEPSKCSNPDQGEGSCHGQHEAKLGAGGRRSKRAGQ